MKVIYTRTATILGHEVKINDYCLSNGQRFTHYPMIAENEKAPQIRVQIYGRLGC